MMHPNNPAAPDKETQLHHNTDPFKSEIEITLRSRYSSNFYRK